jgi:hypothetical protein
MEVDHKKCSERMLQIRIRIVLKKEQSKLLLYGTAVRNGLMNLFIETKGSPVQLPLYAMK